ncbi:DUF5801 repeats-in-toxin domain-containing protein [Rhizobium sp. R86522]|uniref:T1SS-143 repeat domain-containing protein n=1 Tax=Rhizobium sp. R86522 TaxID=3093861 RepID=UPI0036716702
MSIEDPRLSSIDNTSAADDFDSAVEQHLGFASETMEGIEVAQAQTPDAGRTDRLPAQQPVNVAAAVIPSEVTPDNENVVTLPAGIELDNLEFQVDGENLVLVLADGTGITVIGGAANIPTFVVGDVELPQVALFAALEESNINVAAGPDGTFSAQSTPDGNRNFEDNQIGDGFEEFALAGLLDGTSFADEATAAATFGGDGRPSILSPLTAPFVFDEATIADTIAGNQRFSSFLPFEAGPDFGTISAVGFAGAINADEESAGPQILAGFTSGGSLISIQTFPAPTDGTVLNFLALRGVDAQGNVIFTITVDNRVSGAFTFELVGKLDHPDAGQSDLADLLRLGFTYTVTDRDGDFVTGTFNIDIQDDAPERGQEVRGRVEDEGIIGGNNEADGLSLVANGALNIRWGADNGNSNLGGNGDRSVAFANNNVAVSGAFGEALTSLGQPVSFAVINGVLVGYTGDSAPASSEGSNVVFRVSLSDSESGSYVFTLVKPLDHAANEGEGVENDLSLTFGYTATDSDGDTITGNFTVDVRDDVATIGTPFAGGIVEEEQWQVAGDGNEGVLGDGDADTLLNYDRTTHETGGTLAISWGSDNANDGNSQPGDRSVQFGPDARTNLEALNLTSDGDAIKYTTVTTGSGQQVLLAYTGSVIPTTVPATTNAALAANIVFSVALSDNGAGSYAFKLYDTLDHKGSVQGEDSQVLTFQFTATDSDGDVTEPATFSVKVIDDQPFAWGTLFARVVEEEELAGGNEDRTSGSGDIDDDSSLFGNVTTAKANGDLNIFWGGDDGNKNVNGGFTGTQVAGDRSVVFATGSGSTSGLPQRLDATDVAKFLTVTGGNGGVAIGDLTSEGRPLVFALSADGTTLTARAGSVEGPLVFTVKLSDRNSGSFEFDLKGVLDHPVKASGASNEDVLSFKFTFTARDGDGDIVKNDFTVKVIDDVPVRREEVRGTAEDEAVNGGNNEADSLSAVATGALNIRWGADDADTAADLGGLGDRSIAFTNETVTVANAYNGASLTSLGLAVSTTVLANGTLVGYTGSTVPTSTAAANVVFHATLSDDVSGSYVFTLVKPLDHAANEGEGVENDLSLTFGYTATDSDGDTITGNFTVDVRDDVATIGTPFAGGIVEEEQWQVAGDGNEGVLGDGDADTLLNYDRTTHETGGTLAISWGSDNANDGNSQPGDRSVQFGPDARTNLEALNLTSDGDAIKYTTVTTGSGQQVLLAYTGSVIPTTVPATTNAALAANIVFSVALSDNGAGSYAFKLYDTLDHKGSVQGEDSQVLTFQFTATDSDGDVTEPATFSVKVIDDQPFAWGTLFARVVEEEELAGGNEDRTSGSGDIDDDSSLFGNVTTAKANGDLNIFWGGDDGNKNVNGGFTGTQVAGDRSVVFATGSGSTSGLPQRLDATDVAKFLTVTGGNGGVAIGDLTSEGRPLVFALSADGTTLTARAGSVEGPLVFTVKLSDRNSGSFEFDLKGVLDHPVKASGASNEDVLSFKFTFTARDGDGDIVKNDFTVKVIDDVPVIPVHNRPDFRIISDDDTVAGLNGNPNGAGDSGEFHQSGKTLPHSFGADGGSIAWNAGASVVNVRPDNGVDASTISFEVEAGTGNLLIKQAQGDPAADVLIARVTVNPATGAYTYTQVANLLHLDDAANAENDAHFILGYTVTDGDGDTVEGSIDLIIDDDTPVIPVHNRPDFRIISDDDTVAGLNGNPNGAGDSGEFHQSGKTLPHSFGADGGSIAWNAGASVVNVRPDNGVDASTISFEVEAGTGNLLIKQAQGDPAADVLIARVTVNPATGAYTYTQVANLLHLDDAANAENDAHFILGYTVTDGDGDTVEGSIDLIIDDDTPVIPVHNRPDFRIISDDDTVAGLNGNPNGAGDSGEFHQSGKTLPHSFGADGGSIAWNAGASVVNVRPDNGVDASTISFEVEAGTGNLLIKQAQGDPAADVLIARVTVNPATGAYTYTQVANLLHLDDAANAENDAHFILGYTVTDGDGDTVEGSIDLIIDDDTPEIPVHNRPDFRIISDDDTVAGLNGNPNGAGDSGEFHQSGKTLPHSFGADGGSIAWNAGASVVNVRPDNGVDASTISFEVEAGTGNLLIKQAQGDPAADVLIARVTVNPATGAYTYTQVANLLHLDDAANAENDAHFILGYTVTDGDGDTVEGSIDLIIDDDTPEIPVHNRPDFRIISDDDTVAGLNGNPNGAGDSGEFHQSGKTLPHSFGADGGSIAWNAGASVVNVRPDNGVDASTISFEVEAGTGNLLIKQAQGDPAADVLIARVTVNPATGAYTYTQVANLLHLDDAANAENDAHFILGYTVTDGDGDTVEGSIDLIIDDDTPIMDANLRSDVAEDGDTSVTQVLSGLAWGADNGASRTLAVSTAVAVKDQNGAAVSLRSNGELVSFVLINAVLVAYVGDEPENSGATNVVFTVSTNAATGEYSFNLLQPLDHTSPTVNNQYLDLQFSLTAKDSDGDSATGSVSVRVDAAGTISGNTVSYAALSSDVFVNLSGTSVSRGDQTVAADTATDRTGENVIGRDGMAGIVNATGGTGNDILVGGDENNTLNGGDGNDILVGGKGSDTLNGGAGTDTLVVSADIDVTANFAPRTFTTGDGTPVQIGINGKSGEGDALNGGSGVDTVQFEAANGANGFVFDRANASLGLDSVEHFIGTNGDDVILLPKSYSTSEITQIRIDGGRGNDILQGSNAQADDIRGGFDNDTISGLGGDDTLYGNEGDDKIWGGDGNDVIDGGAGNDTLYGNAGNDRIVGGDGDDTIIYTVGDGSDYIQGGLQSGSSYPNYDELVINGDASTRTFTLGIAPMQSLGDAASKDIEVAYTGPDATSLLADEMERVTFNLGANGDTVILNDVTDSAIAPTTVVINGGAGSDTIDLTNFAGSSVKFEDNGAADVKDTVKLAGLWTDYVFTQSTADLFSIWKGNALVATVKGIELIQFSGNGDDQPGYTMSIDKVVNLAPNGVEDLRSVVEAGGVDNATTGTNEATGNVLDNDKDGNFDLNGKIVDKLSVTKVGDTIIDANGEKITGIYGDLVIKSDGSYVYSLDNERAVTQALKAGETKIETFTYTLADNQNRPGTGSLKIEVKGANDAPAAIDFESPYASPGFLVEVGRSSVDIVNLANADALLAGNNQTSSEQIVSSTVNFGPSGQFNGGADFPGGPGDDFAVRASGTINVTASGTWTFGTHSDDGVRLKIDGQVVILDDAIHPGQNNFGQIYLTAGQHTIELVYFEHEGGELVELFAQAGNHTSWNDGFKLIGDVANGGIAVTNLSIDENNEAGAVVATLSARDVDASDSHTFTLVSGEGSADNERFTIVGNQLKLVGSADYEAQSSYSIRVRTTDAAGESYETVRTIQVNDLVENTPATIGGVSTGSVTEDAAGSSQITYSEDFQAGSSINGWTNGFLGGGFNGGSNRFVSENNFVEFDNGQSISKTLALSAAATQTVIDFDFFKIDSWDQGERLSVYLNDQVAFSFTPENSGNDGLDNATGSFTVGGIVATYVVTSSGSDSQLGGGNSGDRVYHIQITASGIGDQIKLGFGNNLNELYTNEDFGIDNIVVHGIEPPALQATGQLTIIDPDAGDASFIEQSNVEGTYGHFTIGSDGKWTYVLDNDSPVTQSLAAGEVKTEVFEVSSKDGTTHEVVVTVNGTNDAPVAANDIVLTNIVDGSQTFIPEAALLMNDRDVDHDDLDISSIGNAMQGTVSGSVVFDPSNPVETILNAKFNGNDANGFVYEDGRFGGLKPTSYADGEVSGSKLVVSVGDLTRNDVSFENRDGGWARSFNLATASTVTIAFDYSLFLSEGTDRGEFARALFMVDGVQYGVGQNPYLVQLDGSDSGGAKNASGQFEITLNLSAGSHELVLGAYINEFDGGRNSREYASAEFDNVTITGPAIIADGSFEYTVSDGDVSDAASVTVKAVASSTINGTGSDEILIAGDGHDILYGMGGSDYLSGGIGDNFLYGGDGDDILVGGLGLNTMSGGEGDDTFVFDASALDDLDVTDVITDFDGDGDVLDVTALLDSLLGEVSVTTHLQAIKDEQGNTTVSVQTDANTWKDVVVLQNHDTAIKVLFDDKHAVVTPHD